jgi:beta-lactamase class A
MITTLLLAAAALLPLARPSLDDSLAARLRARIAEVPGAEVGVAYRDLGSRDSLDLASDAQFHAASTMKLPVLIELFRQADAGRLSLDQPVLLENRFHSIVDGSPYALSPGDDSDSLVYTLVGTRVTLRELAERMIVRSSNLATNALIELVGARRADSTARMLGARGTKVLRGVEDQKAYDAGLSNVTTAADLAAMLAAIERGEAAASRSCTAMKEILFRQQFNDEIPAGLPPGTPVAHKTGSITAILHDAAIVYPPGRPPYVLVVLTRGVQDQAVARQLIADISRMVWTHATGRAVGRGSPYAAPARP